MALIAALSQKGVQACAFQDGLLIIGQGKTLHYVNATTAFIWDRLLDEEHQLDDVQITAAYVDHFKVGDEDARDALETAEFWLESLVAAPVSPTEPSLSEEGGVGSSLDKRPHPVPSSEIDSSKFSLSVGGRRLDVFLDSSRLRSLVRAMVGHLETDAAGEADHLVWLTPKDDAGHVRVLIDNQEIAEAKTIWEARHFVLEAIARAAAGPDQYFAVLHAAAAIVDGRCVLFTGISGTGKTSLLLNMLQRGAHFVSDDFVPLTGDRGLAFPVPFAIGIKPGTVELARLVRSDIEDLPLVNLRGRMVRYLPPDGQSFPVHREPLSVDMIIFPEYAEDKKPGLKQLDPLEALSTAGACAASFEVDGEKLVRLARWFETVPAYSITYESTERALSLLKDIDLNA